MVFSLKMTTAGLGVAALLLCALPAVAGESPAPAPGPGLEIFNDAGGQGGLDSPSPSAAGGAGPEAFGDDVFSGDAFLPPANQPPYRAPETGTPPPAGQPYGEYPADPFSDPFAGLDEEPGQGAAPLPPLRQYYGETGGQTGYGPGQMEEAYSPPVDPVAVLMTSLNIRSPNFPGLAEAVTANDLPGAGAIILSTLRARRVVDAAMSRGVRGSLGGATPYDAARLMQTVNAQPPLPEDVLAPVHRINTILDTFETPLIDDAGYIQLMPRLLLRLAADTVAVRNAMLEYQYGDEGVFLELARTYFRAATTADFLGFPRAQLTENVKTVMEKGRTMFYPDGSSRAGDSGGISGNLFQIMLMMDYYTRNDTWFRRDIRSIWSTLEKPGRFLLDIARPDGSLPLFGPRGLRELGSDEVAALDAVFPGTPPVFTRLGLAATASFPVSSAAGTYSGMYVLRDVKHPLGRYLAVRFGTPSELLDVPSHNDFGSLELMSRGTRFLTDAGGYGGAAASAAAHGSLSLNGRFLETATYNPAGEPADAVWRTNASLDFAIDQAGYADTKSWQRGVLYVKNLPGESKADYWVVMDHVNSRDDPEPLDMQLRYLLAPGVSAFSEGPGAVMLSGAGGAGLRLFAVDAGAGIQVTDGANAGAPVGQLFDATGRGLPVPSVMVRRLLTGDSTTTTVMYPVDDPTHRPLRIERDSDIIRGRTGLLMIDHGLGRVDVVAWAPPGQELVTPTLNLQLSADLAVFRIRQGKIRRVDFVNLERFQAKEPDGGLWSMRVDGPAQSLTLEPEAGGGWNVLSDPANAGPATFFDVNLGPAVTRREFSIRPGEMRVIFR